MSVRAVSVALLLCGMVSARSDAAAQSEAALGRLVAYTNEPREPEFGKVFDLMLQLRFAPGLVVFVPDTLLPAPDAFSAGAGSFTTAAGPADSIDVQATYKVMGVMNGGVELPMLELLMRPADPGEEPGARPARELAGATNTAVLQRAILEIGGVLVTVPAEMAGREAAIDPRPAADVLGSDWSPWLVAAVGVGALAVVLIASILVSSFRQARAVATSRGPSPRDEALVELDRVLALGWHTDGRIDEFYDATTRVLRQLSEREEPDWSRALTSSELVGRIQGRWGAGSVEKLRPTVWCAEWVKFGSHRPSASAAEQDWSVVRNWIRDLPEG